MAENIVQQSLEEVFAERFKTYGSETVKERSIPSVEDGFLPVMRRIIYTMYKEGAYPRFTKAAQFVGTTIGRYHPHGDCLVGSTKLYGLDGKLYSLEDLTKNEVKSLDVLCYDEVDNTYKAGKAHSFRIGQYADKIYLITLSDNSVIKCTSNHPFFIKGINWASADKLEVGNELESVSINTNFKYRVLRNKDNRSKIFHLVSPEIEKGYVRHHKNHDKHDDRPENIISINRAEHALEHKDYIIGLSNGIKTMKSDRYKEAIKAKNSFLMTEYNKSLPIRKALKVLEYLQSKNIELTAKNYTLHCKESGVYNATKLETLNSKYNTTFEELKKLLEAGGIKLDTEAAKGKTKHLKKDKKECIREANLDKLHSSKFMETIIELFNSDYEYSWDGYDALREELLNNAKLNKEDITKRGIPTSIFIRESLSEDFDDAVSKASVNSGTFFIKSIEIEKVSKTPMYDFTVDGFENALIVTNENEGIYSCIVAHNSSCYESMVGMSQGFRKLNPLIDPQGNNGSVDDFKSFAAMRYLELRLSAFTRDVFFSNFSEKNNNFVPNYDKTHLEPEVFTPVIPTILNNGITAIASGFVCNLPTHRVTDIVEVTKRLIADADISDKELAKGFYPDFPLGATIINRDDLIDMYTKGQGVIQVQATLEDGDFKGKPAIIIRDLPPEVSVNKILEQIRFGLTPEDAKKAKKKKTLTKPGCLIELIQDVKDISTKKEGIGIALLLKKGVDSGTVKNVLYKSTSLRYSVKYQANVLIEGKLESNCSLKKLLSTWIAFRRNTVRRILNIKIADYSEQQSLKQALIKALGKIDKVIEIVQNASDKKEAIDKIRKLLSIGLNQATYIVETKLYQLSKMSVQDLKDEIKTLGEKIKEAVETISDDHRIDEIIVEEMDRIIEKHCKKEKRTTDVINITSSLDDVKAFVQPENLVIGFAKEMDDLDNAGYSSNAYVFAKSTDEIISGDTRGRKGQNFVPSTIKKVIIETFTVNTHDYILCFTTDGKLIIRQGYEFNMWNKPIGAILNLEGRRISTIIPITEKDLDKYLVFVTEAGYMKRIPVDEFDLNRKAAVIAIKPIEGDILKAVSLSLSEIDNVFVYSNEGKAQRLLASQIDEMTRASAGRCRLTLGEDEYVVGLTVGNTDTTKILMCASNGKGKIINLEEFPLRRGDKGRRSMLKAITLAEGEMLIGALTVKEEDSVAFNTSNNKIVSLNVANVTTLGRNAKGMTLAKPSEGEIITSITYSN